MGAGAMVTDVWEWYDTKALELHTVVSPHVDPYMEMVLGVRHQKKKRSQRPSERWWWPSLRP